jgi:acetyl esterase/lipase
MFLHGGGYTRGSSASHGPLAAALAARLGGPAVVPDYRLAPEHPFPAALDDARAAWAGLTGPGGTDPARVVLAGDSAGAGLALALLQELAGAGHPGPSAALLFSPWADLRRTGPETAAAAEGDALLSPRDLALSVAAYTGGDPGLVHDPRVSPVLGSFTALPPLFVAAGGDEVLVPDALTVVAGILAAGGRAELSVTPGLCHDFVVFTTLPESVDLLDRAAAFAARALEDRTGVGT